TVDFPALGRPVNQTVAPVATSGSAAGGTVSWDSDAVTKGLPSTGRGHDGTGPDRGGGTPHQTGRPVGSTRLQGRRGVAPTVDPLRWVDTPCWTRAAGRRATARRDQRCTACADGRTGPAF